MYSLQILCTFLLGHSQLNQVPASAEPRVECTTDPSSTIPLLFLLIRSPNYCDSYSAAFNSFLLRAMSVMAKDVSPSPSPSVADLNACVSTSTGGHHHHHRPVAKETTFREWMLANQIGMLHCFSCIGVGIENGGEKKWDGKLTAFCPQGFH